MEELIVNSWDELIEKAGQCVTREISPDKIRLKKDLVLKVRICGETWDEYIDYRGAAYIQELQKSVNRLYKELIGADGSLRDVSKKLTVKVKVAKGSQEYIIKLIELIPNMIDKLDGGQATFIMSLGLLCITGYLTKRKILDHKKQLELKARQHDHDTKQGQAAVDVAKMLTPVISRALEVVDHANLEKAPRALISKLEDDDTISFPGAEQLPAEKARQLYPRKPRSSTKRGHFDDIYKIININIDKKPAEFTLDKDGFPIKADAQLLDKDIEPLFKKLRVSLTKGEALEVPLQVFITYTKSGIKTAAIIGIGEKRETSKNISELIQELG